MTYELHPTKPCYLMDAEGRIAYRGDRSDIIIHWKDRYYLYIDSQRVVLVSYQDYDLFFEKALYYLIGSEERWDHYPFWPNPHRAFQHAADFHFVEDIFETIRSLLSLPITFQSPAEHIREIESFLGLKNKNDM